MGMTRLPRMGTCVGSGVVRYPQPVVIQSAAQPRLLLSDEEVSDPAGKEGTCHVHLILY